MKLKTSQKKNYLWEKLSTLAKKRSVLFTLIGYNLFLLVAALVVFYTLIPSNYRTAIFNKLPSFSAPANYIESVQTAPEVFKIDIKHKNFQKLAYIRSVSLQKGSLYDGEENSAPAKIMHNGETYKVELSLKGRLKDHWFEEDMWSLKVKVKEGKTILGMKNFAIQHPRARNYLNEWIFHKLLGHAGIINLRYDFIKVDINGNGSRVYALEEKFEKRLVENNRLKEGPIFKFNRDYYWDGAPLETEKDLWASDIAPFQAKRVLEDSLSLTLFNKAKTLVEAFRQERLTASQVFDTKKLAMFFAVMDLTGYHHACSIDNLRFYYNPITSLIEPVPYDNESYAPLREQGLLGTGKQLGKSITHQPRIRWKNTAWYEAVFKDPVFYREYIKALGLVSETDFLDRFFKDHRQEISEKYNIIHADHPGYAFEARSILYDNQAYIKRAIGAKKLLQVYFKSFDKRKGQIKLEVANIFNMPVELLEANIGDSIRLEPLKKEMVLQANAKLTPVKPQTLSFKVPSNMVVNDSLIRTLQLTCNILGNQQTIHEKIIPWPIANEEYLVDDLMRKPSNVNAFSFLKVDEDKKEISFASGAFKIDQDLIIPKGYELIIGEGTSINLQNKANILSRSPLSFIGSEDNPIKIYSSDSTSQGLIIMDVLEQSILKHVVFNNLSNPKKDGWSLSGSVTFYKSPVIIDYCFFGNNQSGDDYLNIVQSTYEINNSIFKNTFADAFDGDFSDGSIKNIHFSQVGNDAIDISGSNLSIENALMENIEDKGLSAGENSRIEAKQVRIQSAEIAVTSKDLSTVSIDDIEIKNCAIAYTAFQKKQEYGSALIMVTNNALDLAGIEIDYLIEEGSKMFVNDKQVGLSGQTANVKEILYGVKYGKSSK